jgi:hypothetical protein
MSCNGIEPLLGTPVPAQIPWPGEIPGTAAPSCGAPALFMFGALRKENAGFLPLNGMDFRGDPAAATESVFILKGNGGKHQPACSLCCWQSRGICLKGVCAEVIRGCDKGGCASPPKR